MPKNSYYDSVDEIKEKMALDELLKGLSAMPRKPSDNVQLIQKDALAKTMGFKNEQLDGLAQMLRKQYQEKRQTARQLSTKKPTLLLSSNKLTKKIAKTNHDVEQLNAIIERGFSLGDLTENSYNRQDFNPNTMSNWFLPLKASVEQQSFFKLPETKILHMPIEIAQYLKHDFATETNQISRDKLNRLLFNAFDLDENTDYFIKLGNFSSKFEFQNAHIDDPKAIGDYFNVISNFAMMIGASLTNELVVREWLADPENRPTMYDGMPLRSEFRTFIDADTKTIIDVLPYWNNKKVEHELALQAHANINSEFQAENLAAFKAAKPLMDADYDKYRGLLTEKLSPVLDKLNLSGIWSLDIMKSGDDFYIIDMATAQSSALFENADNARRVYDFQKRQAMKLPIIMPAETAWKFGLNKEDVVNADLNNQTYLKTRNVDDLKLTDTNHMIGDKNNDN